MIPEAKPDKQIKRRNAAQTKARLLEVGEGLFADRGFERTTLEMIADAANVNKAMIRYYYGDKDGLYTAIIEAVVTDVLAALQAALPAGSDPADELADYIEILATAIMARPSFPRMILRDYLDGDIMSREGPSKTLFQFMQTTRRYYDAGFRAGQLRELEPHMLHLSIVSSAIFFTVTRRLRSNVAQKGYMPDETVELETQAFAQHLRDLIMTGVRKPKDID
jgi:TetR/AcrR family transcriptional regulator